jgi:hypothetical protein
VLKTSAPSRCDWAASPGGVPAGAAEPAGPPPIRPLDAACRKPGQGDEEPVPPGHVHQPRGTFQRELPVDPDVRHPPFLLPVLDAEQGGANRTEHVMPRRGPDRRVRPEPAQQPQPDQRRQPVPGGGDVPEPERGELVGGQYPVHGHQTDQVAVTVGQVRGRGQHRSLILGTCPRPGPARVRM